MSCEFSARINLTQIAPSNARCFFRNSYEQIELHGFELRGKV